MESAQGPFCSAPSCPPWQEESGQCSSVWLPKKEMTALALNRGEEMVCLGGSHTPALWP